MSEHTACHQRPCISHSTACELRPARREASRCSPARVAAGRCFRRRRGGARAAPPVRELLGLRRLSAVPLALADAPRGVSGASPRVPSCAAGGADAPRREVRGTGFAPAQRTTMDDVPRTKPPSVWACSAEAVRHDTWHTRRRAQTPGAHGRGAQAASLPAASSLFLPPPRGHCAARLPRPVCCGDAEQCGAPRAAAAVWRPRARATHMVRLTPAAPRAYRRESRAAARCARQAAAAHASRHAGRRAVGLGAVRGAVRCRSWRHHSGAGGGVRPPHARGAPPRPGLLLLPCADVAAGCVTAQAESFLPARTEASLALAAADARVEDAKTWFWRLRAEDAARVRALQAERAQLAAAAGRADADWARHVRAARSQLGVWSDAGVREARKQFWRVPTLRAPLRVGNATMAHSRAALRRRAYEGGKVFAQRHTFYDVFLLMLRRSSEEENMFSFLVKCGSRHLALLRLRSRAAPTPQLHRPRACQLHCRECVRSAQTPACAPLAPVQAAHDSRATHVRRAAQCSPRFSPLFLRCQPSYGASSPRWCVARRRRALSRIACSR